ncbi:VPA1269 family protein [Shewanella baltica]|uniref:VPA1269 family protein n=1 Tax=Shewanella baltica TaxID=62322 RepID=UPI003D797DFB
MKQDLNTALREYLVIADQNERMSFHSFAQKSSIFVEAFNLMTPLKAYGNAKSTSAIDHIDIAVSVLLILLKQTYRVHTLTDITYKVWEEALDTIKEPKHQYNDDIPERFQTGCRAIAKILDHIHKTSDFSFYAKIHRINKHTALQVPEKFFSPDLAEWVKYFFEYVDFKHIKGTRKSEALCLNFLEYLQTKDSSLHHPMAYLAKDRSKIFLEEFREMFNHKLVDPFLYVFHDFSMYIIDEYMSDIEGDEVTHLGYPIITERQVKANSGAVFGKTKTESTKELIPPSILYKMKEVLTENDYAFPKSLSSHYFIHTDSETGETSDVWNIVPTYFLLLMLEIPIRRIQAQMLDSGEGDEHKFDLDSMTWVENDSIHSGYWRSIGASNTARGIVTKITLKDEKSAYQITKDGAGFYINTNKTADIKVGFGEHSGYTIPWQNQALIKYCNELVEWQSKYNPLLEPTAYADLPAKVSGEKTVSASVIAETPDRFYLFRNPSGDDPRLPVTHNVLMKFFNETLAEVERQLRAEAYDVTLVTNWNGKQPATCKYTMHGLRVAGLSALSKEGVPLEVLSKLVAGHASIFMTLYYIKYSNAEVNECLTDARKEIEDKIKEDLAKWLNDATYDEAKRYLAANDDNAIKAALANQNINILGGIPYGMCPHSGTRCNDGGEIVKAANKAQAAQYAPVKGGKENCVMCRHFVTGKPWLIELWLHTNKLFELARSIQIDIDKLLKDLKSLNSERYAYVKRGEAHLIPSSVSADIKCVQALIDNKTEALDDVLISSHAAYKLTEEVRVLPEFDPYNENQNSAQNALVKSDHIDDAQVGFAVSTDFIAQNHLVTASRLYPHVADKRMELERNNFTDQILMNNGIRPISLSPLTEKEKRSALDAVSNFLIRRVGAVECEQLHSGAITLEQLGVKDICIPGLPTKSKSIPIQEEI